MKISDERLRNTRAWAAVRIGQMSGAEVIVGAIDELFDLRTALREIGYEPIGHAEATDSEVLIAIVGIARSSLETFVEPAMNAPPRTGTQEEYRQGAPAPQPKQPKGEQG